VSLVADDEVETSSRELGKEFWEFFVVCEEDLVGSRQGECSEVGVLVDCQDANPFFSQPFAEFALPVLYRQLRMSGNDAFNKVTGQTTRAFLTTADSPGKGLCSVC